MKRWERLDTQPSPGGDLTLWRRGQEYTIYIGNTELMGSKQHHSEDELGRRCCEGLPPRSRALIGGLGMGFTLAAALRAAGPDVQVVVAEANPVVANWNRGHLGPLAGQPLQDPRSRLFLGDVREAIAEGGWHAILLDVDNGPEALSRPENAGLYSLDGLRRSFAALVPGGRLGVWSVHDDHDFTKRLWDAGFRAEALKVPAWPGSQIRHVLWMARRPG
jgi:spermidine synthase